MANIGYIQVARICNQRCLFCSNPDNDRIIPVAEAAAKASSLADEGYYGVILTGGEPTLHPNLEEIIAHAASCGLEVRIITNGQKTADPNLLKNLVDAGLKHVHVSVHTCREQLQAELSQNPDSLANILKTLDNIEKLGITCDINTVMCAQNADHLDETVRFLVERYPFIRHFVFNNIDPSMNRVAENPHTVARLADLELSLHRALGFLEQSGRTYRVERLPLCYMVEFAHASTETRKIVKSEERTVHFLDQREKVTQKDFHHRKAKVCAHCSLDGICAGLYDMDGAYDSAELHPIFIDPEPIVRRIIEGR
ncbi:MAG: radical SAM protein [Deltaproteobacteria bacterium]|nr:MAG: radical SAM protein [Deltaproteobacteria bacterium]